jgi:hypothetical protein
MFVATALLYPCVLAALCAGAGLLVDRCSARFLPAPLLLPVGLAALIAVSQLSTYVSGLAPATPYLLVAVAVAGFVLARERARPRARQIRRRPWLPAVTVLAYLIALAPVLLAGRATFSSYMALADSAVHMLGADFLLRHGQDYAHLDLRNSYGQFINDYYNSSYPSGADTLFGGSGFLLGLPLIWAFQPFNAFVLATAAGPAWLLARRMRLDGPWAALAALTAVLPALVYAYELFGSVKELTALSMILTLGALTVLHERWLGTARGSPARAIPFALVLAAGVSALGLAFGAWALVAVLVLAGVLLSDLLRGRRLRRSALLTAGAAAAVLLIAAWPTWRQVSGSLKIAQDIANTANSGNLRSPLRASQVLGIWLGGSYKLAPTGAALALTHALITLMLLCAVLGAVHVLRIRAHPLAAWIALMLLAWLAVTHLITTWGSAKALMLTSPVVVLLAWGGVAELKALAPRPVLRACAALLALVLAGGVLASDLMQYRSSDLAPTARYQELALINSRFAGRGPTLFTDFDEWALYQLRNLDIGGPDFVYPPPAVAVAADGYGDPVQLDLVSPRALLAYPLIVARRDPLASRPPSAYRLAWQGSYYQVWKRTPGAAPAIVHIALSGAPALQCTAIARLAQSPRARGDSLVGAQAPELVPISLARSTHPAGWGHQREGLVMSRPGELSATFELPAPGPWEVWVQGQIMPTVQLTLDGHPIGSIGGQLAGDSLVPDTVPPIPVRLLAGAHRLTVTRPGSSLAPGDRGSAVLDAVFLTPAGDAGRPSLRSASASHWRELCGHPYQWVELLPR